MAVHIVQSGETLWGLSQKYGIPIDELKAVNGLPNISIIVPGQSLYIPRPPSRSRIYRIRVGDSYWKLANEFNTTIASIIHANPNVDPNNLQIGQILTIPTSKKMQIVTLGFVVPYSQEDVLLTLSSLTGQLTFLAIAAYSFTAEGYAYVQLEDQDIIAASVQGGVSPLLMIRNLIGSAFNPELVGNVLENPTYRNNLIASIVNLSNERGFKGVSIDFEFIPPARRQDFLVFLADLKAALGPLILHVNVHAKTEDVPNNPIIGAYDYQAIGNIADIVAVMTIDYGYPGGPPEPVSPAWWIEQVIQYSIKQINRKKLQISIPLYGYDKRKIDNETKALSVLAAQNFALSIPQSIQYETRAESPFYTYWVGRYEHVVWFEDIRSYQAKYQLIDMYQLLGATIWQLTQLAPQNWGFIRDNIRVIKY